MRGDESGGTRGVDGDGDASRVERERDATGDDGEKRGSRRRGRRRRASRAIGNQTSVIGRRRAHAHPDDDVNIVAGRNRTRDGREPREGHPLLRIHRRRLRGGDAERFPVKGGDVSKVSAVTRREDETFRVGDDGVGVPTDPGVRDAPSVDRCALDSSDIDAFDAVSPPNDVTSVVGIEAERSGDGRRGAQLIDVAAIVSSSWTTSKSRAYASSSAGARKATSAFGVG